MNTLEGLRMLWQKRKSGEQLPLGWFEGACYYLQIKRRACKKFNRDWDQMQLMEAEKLIFCLIETGGLPWKQMRK